VQSSAWEPRGGVRHPSAGKAPREVSQRKTLDHRRPQGQKPPPVQLSVLGPSGGDDAGSGITADSHHGARVISLEQAPDDGPHVMVRLLARVIGVGVETADMLVQEVLSRNLRDRRAVARYGGLTGSPDESGKKRREKGLARSGNARVRRGMIQLAWRFLMFQKDGALAHWFYARTKNAPQTRKTMIVALARKLLIALWRLARDGVVPEGVRMRPAA
jgi:transposase